MLDKNKIESLIYAIPDFPKPGILFRDITPLLAHPEGIRSVVEMLYVLCRELNLKVDKIAAMESRGFLFGVPLAERLNVGFLPIRKPGKLPRKTYSESYSLEYGQDALEIHVEDLSEGEHILLVDDLLATGGTAFAAAKLIEKSGAKVEALLFLMELIDLPGASRLQDYRHYALLEY